MPERPALSVIVITRNEAARIRRCLDGVRWAEELVVVDDASADATAEICRASGARVIVRPMRDGFGEQKAFALAQARQPWVLSVDADEVVTPALRQEIEAALADPGDHVGYRIPRLTDYLGRPIRHCGWYPLPVLRLFRRDRARFSDALVHEEVLVDGPVGDLRTDLLHWSYDSLTVHAAKTRLYSGLEARMLERNGVRPGGLATWWLLVVRPAWIFVRKYLLQRGWLEGWHGVVLSVLTSFGVFVANVRLAERSGWLRGFAR
jgi:glycosyltransferase involved in cell wall biosynthesis